MFGSAGNRVSIIFGLAFMDFLTPFWNRGEHPGLIRFSGGFVPSLSYIDHGKPSEATTNFSQNQT
jgi:hypothetical protein